MNCPIKKLSCTFPTDCHFKENGQCKYHQKVRAQAVYASKIEERNHVDADDKL